MQTTHPDPIIAELRTVRDAHAARFDYDVKAIFRDIRAIQETIRSRICPISLSTTLFPNSITPRLDDSTLSRFLIR